MEKDIRKSYRRYLRLQKNFTENTIDAYLRDLDKLLRWLQSTGVEAVEAKIAAAKETMAACPARKREILRRHGVVM